MNRPVWLIVGTGLLFVLIAIPLMLRKVPRNPLYGLRVPATWRSEWVWYEANAKSGRDLLIFGLIVAGSAVALHWLALPVDTYETVLALILIGGAVLTAAIGWRRANYLERMRSQADMRVSDAG